MSDRRLRPEPLLSVGAWPAGPPDRDTAERLLGIVEGALAEAPRGLDALLVDLHGSMVAADHPDVEAEVLALVRRHLGQLPVVAVLDLHGSPSRRAVELCDAMIAYDTYPHIDMWERGAEAAVLALEAARGTEMVTVVEKLPLLTTPLSQATDQEPMRGLLSRARRISREAGLRRVSLLPGFPYADVPRAGFAVLGVAKADEVSSARDALRSIAADVDARQAAFAVERPAAERAVADALAAPPPVVLVDLGDNVGAGGPGDGTALLRELISRRVDAAVVTIADAPAVARAAARGPGSRVTLEVGGRADDVHGAPVPMRGTVRRVCRGSYTASGSWMTGRRFDMGTTALVEANGIQLVLTERATPPFHAEQLTSLGLDLSRARVVTAKSAIAWHAAFGDVARSVIEVDTPGVTPLDVHQLPRRSAPAAE